MNRAVPDCLVTGYEEIIDGLQLPDPDDRHVLAAAIRVGASVIVTYNLKDFSSDYLGKFGIEAQHPDEFVAHLIDLSPGAVCGAMKKQRESLKSPPKTVEEYLDTLTRQELSKTVARLREYGQLI